MKSRLKTFTKNRVKAFLNFLPWSCAGLAAMGFMLVVGRYRLLSSSYLISAEHLGKSYAKSLKSEDSDGLIRIFHSIANDDKYDDLVLNIYLDLRLTKLYYGILIVAFEKELMLQKRIDMQATMQADAGEAD